MNRFFLWLQMGGYASYVWSSYGIAFFIALLSVLNVQFQRIRIIQMLETNFLE